MKPSNAMPDKNPPKGITRISGLGQSKRFQSGTSTEGAASEVSQPEMRSRDESVQIARRLAENGDLARRFEEVRGTDQQRAGELIDEITLAARKLDGSITDTEGMRITLILLEMFSGTGSQSNGRRSDKHQGVSGDC